MEQLQDLPETHPLWQKVRDGSTKLDKDLVRRFAEMNISDAKIAEHYGIDVTTLQKHYGETIKKGKLLREMRLRYAQYKIAVEDENASMLIHLGKSELGQSDKQTIIVQAQPSPLAELTDEELDRLMEEQKKLGGPNAEH